MTDEQKQECKCECYKIAAKFLFLTTSIFIGTLLAIIFAAHLLKPAVPPCYFHKGMHKMHPKMERFNRQMPPAGIIEHQRKMKFYRNEDRFGQKDFKGMPKKGEQPVYTNVPIKK